MIAAPTLTAAPCPRGTLTGQVTFVRDGDTIVVGSMPIRLNGLAAPEWDEPGGDAATDAMIELVEGRTLRCELNGERTHDRCVGVCYLEGKGISDKTTPAATGGDLAELWRERVAALVEGNYDRSYDIDDLIRRHGRPTPPGSRFSSVSSFTEWMWKAHRMIAR